MLISFPEKSLSFLIRIWIEPREIKDAPVIWRGVIETIYNRSSGEPGHPDSNHTVRRAFKDLDELLEFLKKSLEELGIPPEQLRRLE